MKTKARKAQSLSMVLNIIWWSISFANVSVPRASNSLHISWCQPKHWGRKSLLSQYADLETPYHEIRRIHAAGYDILASFYYEIVAGETGWLSMVTFVDARHRSPTGPDEQSSFPGPVHRFWQHETIVIIHATLPVECDDGISWSHSLKK